MKTFLTHAEFSQFVKEKYGVDLKITRSQAVITQSVSDAVMVAPTVAPAAPATPEVIVPLVNMLFPDYFNPMDKEVCMNTVTRKTIYPGNIIATIKKIREMTGLGLKAAKDLCDLNWLSWS